MQTVANKEKKASDAIQERPYLAAVVDIVEDKEAFVLHAEMPGVPKNGLEILLEGNELTLIGHRAVPSGNWEVLYRESQPLDYRRVFELNPEIDTKKIKASLDKGVLKLVLPKAEHVKPRRIAVTD